MTLTSLGVRRFMEWMRFVEAIGWEKSTWNLLGDLWLEHHDDAGNLTRCEPQSQRPEEKK